MTVEEMASRIIEFVDGYQPASMVELVKHLGADARGNLIFHMPERPNTVIWTDVSKTFVDAFMLARKEIFIDITNPMIYLMDGGTLPLPIAKKFNGPDYKKEHWVPVILSIKKTDALKEVAA